jgi:hypothetical protein
MLSMASFSILLFFAVTGITLNHQGALNAEPKASRFTGSVDLAWVNPPAGRDVARVEIVEHYETRTASKPHSRTFGSTTTRSA